VIATNEDTFSRWVQRFLPLSGTRLALIVSRRVPDEWTRPALGSAAVGISPIEPFDSCFFHSTRPSPLKTAPPSAAALKIGRASAATLTTSKLQGAFTKRCSHVHPALFGHGHPSDSLTATHAPAPSSLNARSASPQGRSLDLSTLFRGGYSRMHS